MTTATSPTRFPVSADEERLIGYPYLFEAQVQRTPHATAVVFEDVEYTYTQLNALANQIAWMLQEHEVQREQRVGICLDRSLEAIAAMLGILKAGATFVPLDPDYPPDRLEHMVAGFWNRTDPLRTGLRGPV